MKSRANTRGKRQACNSTVSNCPILLPDSEDVLVEKMKTDVLYQSSDEVASQKIISQLVEYLHLLLPSVEYIWLGSLADNSFSCSYLLISSSFLVEVQSHLYHSQTSPRHPFGFGIAVD